MTTLYQTYKALKESRQLRIRLGKNIYGQLIEQNNNLRLIINENTALKQEYQAQLTVVNDKLAIETNPEEIVNLNNQKKEIYRLELRPVISQYKHVKKY